MDVLLEFVTLICYLPFICMCLIIKNKINLFVCEHGRKILLIGCSVRHLNNRFGDQICGLLMITASWSFRW